MFACRQIGGGSVLERDTSSSSSGSENAVEHRKKLEPHVQDQTTQCVIMLNPMKPTSCPGSGSMAEGERSQLEPRAVHGFVMLRELCSPLCCELLSVAQHGLLDQPGDAGNRKSRAPVARCLPGRWGAWSEKWAFMAEQILSVMTRCEGCLVGVCWRF